uniref:F-box domain-containing protein n=1 Tax=Psilocybe cubensis TaxID=181762 RepID=A0A8H7XJR5_PSICU
MSRFPYELWLLIISYLLDHEIWNLCTVNKSIRNIAMSRLYEKVAVSMKDVDVKKYRHQFLRLSEDGIAPHVRYLSFDPYVRSYFPPAIQTSRRTVLIKKLFSNLLNRDDVDIIHAIDRFINLRHIEIQYQSVRPIPLTKCGPLIRNLSDVNEHFAYTATKVLVPFINRHRLSLSILELTLAPLPPTWDMYSLSLDTTFNLFPLLISLDHIPNLRYLTIALSSFTSIDSTYHFLEMHSSTLRRLKIDMTHMELTTTHGVLDQFKVPLPLLEEIVVQYYYDTKSLTTSPYQEPTLGFIRQHSSTLTSLKLLNSFHTEAHFHAVVDPKVSYHSLRLLKMTLDVLTPGMLSILSSRLENLYELDLLASKIGGKEWRSPYTNKVREWDSRCCGKNAFPGNIQRYAVGRIYARSQTGCGFDIRHGG